MGVLGADLECERRLQRAHSRTPVRPFDGDLPARHAQRCRKSGDRAAPESLLRGLQQSRAERGRRVESRQAGRHPRRDPRKVGLPRQLRRQLLRRGADPVPDGERERTGAATDAGAAAVHARHAESADATPGVRAHADRVRVPHPDVGLHVQSRLRDHRSRPQDAVHLQLDHRVPTRSRHSSPVSLSRG